MQQSETWDIFFGHIPDGKLDGYIGWLIGYNSLVAKNDAFVSQEAS